MRSAPSRSPPRVSRSTRPACRARPRAMTTSASSSGRARAASTRRVSSSTVSSNSGPTGAPAMLFSNTVGNAAASLVALEEKLRGPNTTVSYKEASGLAAAALATDLVRAGKAGALVTGGAEDIYDLLLRGARLVRRPLARRCVSGRCAAVRPHQERLRDGRGRLCRHHRGARPRRGATRAGARRGDRRRRHRGPDAAQRVANRGRHRWCGACAPRSTRAGSPPDRSAPSMRRPMGRWTSIASKRRPSPRSSAAARCAPRRSRARVGEGGMSGAASLVTAVLAGASRRRRADGRADRSRSVLRFARVGHRCAAAARVAVRAGQQLRQRWHELLRPGPDQLTAPGRRPSGPSAFVPGV